jgi:UDP:flavonoid glycosyltransferase YjiC (YdhE family)
MSRRFLITSWDGGGNTNPALHLGSRLVQRGHEVRVLGWPTMANRVAATGLEFGGYDSAPPWPEGLRLEESDRDLDDAMIHGPGIVRDVVNVAEAFRPDVLVIDCMMRAPFVAAQQLQIPSAVLVHVLYRPFVDMWGDQLMGEGDDVRTLLGRSNVVLVLTPPGFDEAGELPANTRYVGPVGDPAIDAADDADLQCLTEPGDPWVLLSLSTTLQGQVEALPVMLDAVSRLPIRVFLTLGGAVAPGDVQAPGNVTVREFVPHRAVLPHVAAVISHAGLSTITATLAAGVPLVCIPQGRDQNLNAARVEACGAGRVVATDAPAAQIAAAIDSVLRDDAVHNAAAEFARVIAQLGNGTVATDEVERLADPDMVPPVGVEPTLQPF